MENRQQQILSEIQEMMSSIRTQLEKLDAKMSEFQQFFDPEGVEGAPIDLEIDADYLNTEVVELVELDIPESAPIVAVEPEPTAEPEPTVEPEPMPEDEEDDLPLFAEPEPIFEAAQKAQKPRRAVIDVMEDKQAWRTDMPGAPVKDILSAISLNDRVQFINVLFDEDPSKFQQARAQINSMDSLDEVVDYVQSAFNWDMSSQVVYRFMMAVRRKVK